ncbi:MAG: chromosomal replication initiator protein DnaA [Clostridiales Family XIII bacterium]|jgi:chromosomal replication initiator protein|nr:chromosomal replication initiator protein DnaA [Clostridiales Family XIII bacterium]
MEKLATIWKNALELLQSELTPVSYNTWILPLVPVKIDSQKNTLSISTEDFVPVSVLERYKAVIEEKVSIAANTPLKVSITSRSIFSAKENETEDFPHSAFSEENIPNPRYSFASFVIGKNNRFAHAAALAVAETPSRAYNPLFIYGAAGLGKTHLMHAIWHYINQKNPVLRVLYVSSEMFTNELIKAIKENKNVQFRNKYRNIDVFLIDDIQFIEKKETTQEEIFHTINTLYEANKQIIISSDRPPKDLSTLNDRLRSRFEWGLVADIQAPDYETRVAILQNKAEMEIDGLSDDFLGVINLIAEKIHSNIRELEGALNRVIAHGLLLEKNIDQELAREVLKDIFSSKENQPTPEDIKKQVCKHFDIKLSDLESPKRSRKYSYPRQIAMYLCRTMTTLSLPKIGECFGNKDHTTVLYACDKIIHAKEMNHQLENILLKMEEDIRNS